MRTWMADLLGLAIGFALGGALLVHYLPQLEQIRRPQATVVQPAIPAAPAAMTLLPRLGPPAPPPRQAALAPPAPAPSPDDIVNEIPGPAPLPEVSDPDDPNPGEAAPGAGDSGTGFFATDHLVMTAAHVVPACRRVLIASPFLPPTAARIEARDTQHDMALLRVTEATAPAVLAMGRPTSGSTRVFVLGYPATASLLVPEATWGTLENDKLPHDQPLLTDPRNLVWMQAAAVTHGYSGGPIFDPHAGKVVGIVRAGLDPEKLRAVQGMPTDGVEIGPGSALLNTFLQDESPGAEAFPADQWGDDPIAVVRRATVHVICWH